MIKSGLLSITIFLTRITLKVGQVKYLLLILCFFVTAVNPWTYEIKDYKGEKKLGVFMEKNCCRVNL